MTNFLETGFAGGRRGGEAALNKKDVTGLRQKRHSVHECKNTLNLAYKVVNYVFDSEISQTAGAKEYKLTQGVGRSGKKYIQTGKCHQSGCLSSTSSTVTTFNTYVAGSPTSTKIHKPTSQLLFRGFYVQPRLSITNPPPPFRKLGHTVYNHQRKRARPESKRMCKPRL